MKKLERIRELVLKEKCRLTRLRKHGFVRIPTNKHSSSGHVYINRRRGVVVKRPYLLEKTRVPDGACPTLVLHSPEPYWGQLNVIHIQPLCHTDDDSKWAAYSILQGKEREGLDCGPDLKESNCGMYKRKPVVFDW